MAREVGEESSGRDGRGVGVVAERAGGMASVPAPAWVAPHYSWALEGGETKQRNTRASSLLDPGLVPCRPPASTDVSVGDTLQQGGMGGRSREDGWMHAWDWE
jgi:hypothetical protein